MSKLRFESLELDYGCLHGRYRFPSKGEPIVVVGSNGSGKSTLVDGLVRTLFGFNRREPDARQQQEHRRPWKGGAFRAVLELADAAGRLSITRDFETHEVIVSRPATGEELLRGEANPAAPTSSNQREYRQLLETVVGLVELSDYERTACIHQGRLLETALAQDLLRIAAGGHADVEAARVAIRGRYHELTLAPIEPGGSRRRKAGALERLEAELEKLDSRLEATRRAEDERAPLLHAGAALAADLDRLREDVRRLEERHAALARLRVLQGREETSLQRIQHLEEAEKELRETIWKVEAADDRSDVRAFPPDYLERLASLEELWPRLDEVRAAQAIAEREPVQTEAATGRAASGRLAAGAVLVAVGAVLVGLGEGWVRAWGAALALAGVGLVGLALRSRAVDQPPGDRVVVERGRGDLNIEAIESRIESRLEGLPGREELTPETLADRRREFAAWRSNRDRLEETERRLREATGRAIRTLGSGRPNGPAELPDPSASGRADEPAELPEPSPSAPDGSREGAIAAGRRLLSQLEATLSCERNDVLAPTRIELERERSAVGETETDAREAFGLADRELQERRLQLTAKVEDERDIQRRLLDLGRPEESSVALMGARRAVESSLIEARREAAAYAGAWALLEEAYEEFRETDQERLVGHIDAHLAVLGGGRLGPLVVPGDLDSASLLYAGRPVALSSPPLSYGELHVVLFAVRIGAADFLAGLGVGLPLLVDDPFVHLDVPRAGQVWQLLRTIARDRQVLVTTQDRLVVEHLGIRPDHDLDGPRRPLSTQMELPVDGGDSD